MPLQPVASHPERALSSSAGGLDLKRCRRDAPRAQRRGGKPPLRSALHHRFARRFASVTRRGRAKARSAWPSPCGVECISGGRRLALVARAALSCRGHSHRAHVALARPRALLATPPRLGFGDLLALRPLLSPGAPQNLTYTAPEATGARGRVASTRARALAAGRGRPNLDIEAPMRTVHVPPPHRLRERGAYAQRVGTRACHPRPSGSGRCAAVQAQPGATMREGQRSAEGARVSATRKRGARAGADVPKSVSAAPTAHPALRARLGRVRPARTAEPEHYPMPCVPATARD